VPYLIATKETTGKLIRNGQDIKFRAGFQIAGTPGLNSGGIITVKLAGAIAGLGLADKDSLILTYSDWSPNIPAAAPSPVVSSGSVFPKDLDLAKYPYYSQRDAKGHGEAFRMCNSSSRLFVCCDRDGKSTGRNCQT
jgi:hypothetical protein